jgi:HK97 family phage prohead protease
MKDELKSIGAELAAEIVERFQSAEVRKLLADTKAAADAATGTFEVVITTENLDRYQEVIKLDGWDLTHYLNNPVVLWGHDHNQPIGMATSVEVVDGKMVAKGKFAPTDKAQEVRKLYDFGIIRATSVGFLEKEREGNLITKAELLEFSFVSVPANPYALSLAMEKELSVNELVTKGLMFVERTAEPAEEPAADAEAPAEVVVTEAAAPVEERSFSTKQIAPVIDSLKAAILALEALGITAKEPEGDEADEATEATEEEKAFAVFNANRKTLQDAATIIGDVLAEARQAVQTKLHPAITT